MAVCTFCEPRSSCWGLVCDLRGTAQSIVHPPFCVATIASSWGHFGDSASLARASWAIVTPSVSEGRTWKHLDGLARSRFGFPYPPALPGVSVQAAQPVCVRLTRRGMRRKFPIHCCGSFCASFVLRPRDLPARAACHVLIARIRHSVPARWQEGHDGDKYDPWEALAATEPTHEAGASRGGDDDEKLNGLLQRINRLTQAQAGGEPSDEAADGRGAARRA